MSSIPHYRVLLQSRAADDIDRILTHIAADSPTNAAIWFDGLMLEIESLDILPRRHPLAPEAQFFEEDIRQFVYRGHRVLYIVADSAVRILHVRHGARLPIRPPRKRRGGHSKDR